MAKTEWLKLVRGQSSVRLVENIYINPALVSAVCEDSTDSKALCIYIAGDDDPFRVSNIKSNQRVLGLA